VGTIVGPKVIYPSGKKGEKSGEKEERGKSSTSLSSAKEKLATGGSTRTSDRETRSSSFERGVPDKKRVICRGRGSPLRTGVWGPGLDGGPPNNEGKNSWKEAPSKPPVLKRQSVGHAATRRPRDSQGEGKKEPVPGAKGGSGVGLLERDRKDDMMDRS